MAEHALVLITAIFATCALCQWLAWRVQLPPILLLLFAGLISGPVLGVVDPESLMGNLFLPFVSLSVAIILFEGSLTLRFREIFGLEKVIRNLLSVGMLITWLITALAARLFLDIGWPVATLFGAIMVVTGPTVIAPLLRTVRPTAAVSRILRWESILIDSIGAMLAILVYEFIVSGGGQYGLILTFARVVLIGSLFGAFIGYLFGLLLRHGHIPDFLQNIVTLGMVFAGYAAANTLQEESGLVTVTVMGVWLANMRGVDLETILDFKETLSTILISLLFIILSARLEPGPLVAIGWPALAVLATVQLLARPLSIMVSTLGSGLSLAERHLLSWIAPRGIVAASISSLFAYKLEQAGTPDAHLLVPLSFMIIIGTVLIQSATARPIARHLGVMQPDPRGFLIIGANRLAREIAVALAETGVRVVVADASRDNIAHAKILGLETYQGNPVSSHARRHLDLSGIGTLLALSTHESENLAAFLSYRREFGRDRVAMIHSEQSAATDDAFPAFGHRRYLFHRRCTYQALADKLSGNGRIVHEKVMEGGFVAADDPWVLFVVDGNGRILPRIDQRPLVLEKQWQVIRVSVQPPQDS